MDTFYRLASGGTSIEQFAKDVYCKGHLTQEIHSTVKAIMKESQAMNATSSGSQNKRPSITGSKFGIILSETSSPSVTDLCNLLEAALLHGLKEKLSLSKMTSVVLGPRSPMKLASGSSLMSSSSEIESSYCQDFWPIIQILCHNQVSDSLMRLSNIDTDIGRCRAWLRLTLNEGLLGSYMEALTNDTSLLHGFYRSSSYLRDKDHMELLKSILSDIDHLSFQLNYDNSSLNSWSSPSLQMIGIKNKEEPVAVMPAVDALDEMMKIEKKKNFKKRDHLNPKKKDGKSSRTSSLITHDSRSLLSTDGEASSDGGLSASTSNVTVRSEEDRLNVDIVISQRRSPSMEKSGSRQGRIPPPDINVTSPSQETKALSVTSTPKMIPRKSRGKPTDDVSIVSDASSTGNSLGRRMSGWSSSPPRSSSHVNTDHIQAQDYSSMFARYVESTEVILSATPDLKELNLRSTPPSVSVEASSSRKQKQSKTGQSNSKSSRVQTPPRPVHPTSQIRFQRTPAKFTIFNARKVSKREAKDKEVAAFAAGGDFEVIPKSIVLNNSELETQEFLMQLNQIGSEIGLDQQDYKCYSCGRPIGMIYGRYRNCKFDGYNYCVDCHKNEESVIPARVMFNWDFKKYSVSTKNKKLLDATESDPLLDVKIASPLLYSVIPELASCLDLRTQLFYLHAYIFTCQESVALELRKLVWPKEHLFEHVHLYSINDMIHVVSGQLISQIKKAIAFARKHVLSCTLCSQKGFICELCSSPQIIYPFDTASTKRCEGCKAVFHRICVTDKLSMCPEGSSLQDICPRCLRIRRRKLAEESVASLDQKL